MNHPTAQKSSARFEHLDGIRGSMALWVFFGHLYFACNAKALPLGPPGQAVEVFMVLSGFLMAFHWEKRYSSGISANTLGDFYGRRFFRIVPLFALLAIVAHFTHVVVTTDRMEVIQVLHDGGRASEQRDIGPLSWSNLVLHLTFLFGLLPSVVSTNSLPDWSISLEVQFYLIMPFLMVGLRKLGLLTVSLSVLAIGLVANVFIGTYHGGEGFIVFPQPSFLPLKIHVFLVGVLLALAFLRRDSFREALPYLLLTVLIIALSDWSWRVILILMFLAGPLFMADSSREFGVRLLECRFMKWIGDLSYSIYLVHNLIMYPVLAFLVGLPWFVSLKSMPRFGVSLLVIMPLVLLSSYLLFRFVEKPGIRIGRQILSKK